MDQLAGSGENHIGRFLTDHDACCIGIPRYNARHDGSVGNAQPIDTVHSELLVHNRHLVPSHLAGTGRVEDGRAGIADVIHQMLVGVHLGTGQHFSADVAFNGRLLDNRAREPHPGQHCLPVESAFKVVRLY